MKCCWPSIQKQISNIFSIGIKYLTSGQSAIYYSVCSGINFFILQYGSNEIITGQVTNLYLLISLSLLTFVFYFLQIKFFLLLRKHGSLQLSIGMVLGLGFISINPLKGLALLTILFSAIAYNSITPNLRNIPFLKNIIVALIWATSIYLIIPIEYYNKKSILLCLTNFLLILFLSLLSDKIDHVLDKSKLHKTYYSITNTKLYTFSILGIMLLFSLGLYNLSTHDFFSISLIKILILPIVILFTPGQFFDKKYLIYLKLILDISIPLYSLFLHRNACILTIF